MEKITQHAINELLDNTHSGPAVTIYAPMHCSASPPHMTEDQIRIKNLIYAAMDQLSPHNEPSVKLAKQLRQHLTHLLGNRMFWERQHEGLLLCARPGMIRQFQLPIDTEEYVAVDGTFHLTPVFGLLHDAADFYVLSIAQHRPCLYEGDMYNLRKSDIELPETLEASLLLDETPKDQHPQSAIGSSIHTNGYNGRGGAHEDWHNNEIARFFRIIDQTILKDGDPDKPLILAGTDDETAAYKDISKYPHIIDRTISGNYSNVPAEYLYRHAYAIVRDELVAPKHVEAITTYQRLSGTNPQRIAQDQPAIEEAASQGRVDTLILAMQRLTTDTVHDNQQPVARITFPTGSIRQAIHKLALTVQNMRGKIVIVNESQMPARSPMAAVLRY